MLSGRQLALFKELDADEAVANASGRGAEIDALSEQQSRFVDEYLRCLNASAAARLAGYSAKTAQQQGSRLLSNVVIRAELRRRLDEQVKNSQITVAGVLEQLRKLGHADLRSLYSRRGAFLPVHAWPDDIAARVAGVETEEEWTLGGVELSAVKARAILADLDLDPERDFELVLTRVVKVKTWNPNEALQTIARYLQMLVDNKLTVNVGGAIDVDAMSQDDMIAEATRLTRALPKAANAA